MSHSHDYVINEMNFLLFMIMKKSHFLAQWFAVGIKVATDAE